jgi:hypothetical protein
MKFIPSSAFLAALVFLSACGGAGGGASTSSVVSLTGTAATGAAMPFATVTLKDASGNTLTATSDADGKFTVTDISTLTAPFMLKAVGIIDGKESSLYSVLDEKPSGTEAVANITPITNAVVSQLASGDADALFTAPATISTTLSKAKVSAASEALVESVQNVSTQLNLGSTFDPFKLKFTANNSGMDKMLDLVKFQPDTSGTISIQNKAGGTPITIAKETTKAQVSKMPSVETALVNLDVSSIKTTIADLNKALKSKSVPTITQAFNSTVDDNFRHNGLNKSTIVGFLVEDFASANSAEFLNYALGACNTDGTICEGNLITKIDNTIDTENLPIKKTGNTWKFFGNQSVIGVNVSQVLSAHMFKTTDSLTTEGGLHIDLTSGSNVSDGQYTSAKVYFGYFKDSANPFEPISVGSTPVTTAIYELKQLANCGYLVPTKKPDDTVNNDCSNFIGRPTAASSKPFLDAVDQKIADGSFRLRVVANNDTSLIRTFNPNLVKLTDLEIEKHKTKLKSLVKMDEFAKKEITLLPGVSHAKMQFKFGNDLYFVKFERDDKSFQKLGTSMDITEACEKYKADNTSSTLNCATVKASGSITYYFQLLNVPNTSNVSIWLSVNP